MSSKIKRIAKNIGLTFEKDAYWNFFTSYAICSYILNKKGNPKTINKVHKQLKRNPDEIKIADEDWLKKLAELYGVEYDVTGRIVLVQGLHNMFFMIADDDGTIYSTREDQMMPFKSLQEALDEETIFRIVGNDFVQIDNANVEGD